MTAPAGDSSSSTSSSTPKLRAGQVVTYRLDDVLTGREVSGFGLVLEVPAEEGAAVTVAPLADHHVQVLPDKLAPSRAADVLTSVARPEPADS